jgi:hypothetical protein
MPRRAFNVEEANRTLPLVRRIAEDLVAESRSFKRRLEEREKLRARRGVLPPADAKRLRDLEAEIETSRSRIEGFVAELQQIGCEVKDFDVGLLDFPATRRGESILLCWKLGEDRVGWWHTVEGGFAARRPIAVLDEPTGPTREGRERAPSP